MLGSDFQFLFRYCLVIHLTGLKNQGQRFSFNCIGAYLAISVFHQQYHPEHLYSQLKSIYGYFVTADAPSVCLVPNLCSFEVDGPGSDGVEQGAGYFLGCYLNYCPRLQSEYCYSLYTICFSTTFLEIPPETIYSEVIHRIRPEHWVRFSFCFHT